jgi:MoxR-like ATPase
MENLLKFKQELDKTRLEVMSLAQDQAKRHAEESMAYVAQLAEELIAGVKAEVSEVSAPVLKVKINDLAEVKLSRPASPLLDKVLRACAAGEYPMIKGPSGCGKTVTAGQVAEALEMPFYRFVFSPDLGVSALFGRQTASGFVDSVIIKAARSGGVLLLDELDAANESCLLSINALTEKGKRQLANPVTGEVIDVSPELIVISCTNTWGKGADHVYTGRSRLDAASLDRYTPFVMDYCEKIEKEIARAYTKDLELLKKLQSARKAIRKLGASEIISTRSIDKIHNLVFTAGFSESEAINHLTMPWPEGLASQVGLV